jgi:hypothetical protein
VSLWVCQKHGLYGGQLECPKCGEMGEFAVLEDEPAPPKPHAWDDLFKEVSDGLGE